MEIGNGILGMEYWDGKSGWKIGMGYWDGILEWKMGIEYWNGILGMG
jgi:hypothetical protein